MTKKYGMVQIIIGVLLFFILEALFLFGIGVTAVFIIRLLFGVELGVIDGALMTVGVITLFSLNYQTIKQFVRKNK